MDPNNVLLLFLIFQASEKMINKAGELVAEAILKPLIDALESKAKWLAGVDQTNKRWKDYTRAVEDAKKEYLQQSTNRELATYFIRVLYNTDELPQKDIRKIVELSEDFEKLSFLNEVSDLDQITELIYNVLNESGSEIPDFTDFIETSREYWRILEEKLFEQPSYRELIRDKNLMQHYRTPDYASEALYLRQFIHNYQNVDFIGISDIRDRRSVQLDSIFVEPLSEQLEEIRTENDSQDEGLVDESNALDFKLSPTITPIADALRENPKLMILGDPGAGKTTLLKLIALSFAEGPKSNIFQNEKRFPIFISLKDFFNKRQKRTQDYSLIDYLYSQSREEYYIELEPGFFEKRLKQGGCCVCLDGFDEIGGIELKLQAKNNISAFVSRYSNNRFIVSSRQVGYGDSPFSTIEFSHYRILPFDEKAIKRFIQLWFRARIINPAILDKNIKTLTSIVFSDINLKALATNPLMMTIIALVYQTGGIIPNRRTELYETCITTQLETWKKSKGLLDDNDNVHFHYRRLLEHMAFKIQQATENRENWLSKIGDIELLLIQYLTDSPNLLEPEQAEYEAKMFLSEIEIQSGLIVKKGQDSLVFIHLTFQEYLAACDIIYRANHDLQKIIVEIQAIIDDSHWHRVILMLLGIVNKFSKYPTRIIHGILQNQDEYENHFHHRLFLVTESLLGYLKAEPSLEMEILDTLLSFAKSNSPESEDAIEFLGKFQDNEKIRDELVKLAQNKSYYPRLRRIAVNAISNMGFPREAQSLYWSLILDSSLQANSRYLCIQAIEKNIQRNDFLPETIENLEILFNNDEELIELRCCAGVVLSRNTFSSSHVNIFLDLFKHSKQLSDLHWVTSSIGDIGFPDIALDGLLESARGVKTHEDLLVIYRNFHRGLLTEQEFDELIIEKSLPDDHFAFAISLLINQFPQISSRVIEFANDPKESISSRYLMAIALANSIIDPCISAQTLLKVVDNDYVSQGIQTKKINNTLAEQIKDLILLGNFAHPFARVRSISPLLRMDNSGSAVIDLLKSKISPALINDIFWTYMNRLDFDLQKIQIPELITILKNNFMHEDNLSKKIRFAGILCRYGDTYPLTSLLLLYKNKKKNNLLINENEEEVIVTMEINYQLFRIFSERKITQEMVSIVEEMMDDNEVDFSIRQTVYRCMKELTSN